MDILCSGSNQIGLLTWLMENCSKKTRSAVLHGFTDIDTDSLQDFVDQVVRANSSPDSTSPLLELCIEDEELAVEKIEILVPAFRKVLRLHLTGTDLYAEEIEKLAPAIASPFCNIQILDLSNNAINGIACRHLGHALAANTSIVFLNLSDNGIYPAGAAVLAAAFGKNKTIKEVALEKTHLDAVGVSFLARGLSLNRNITTMYMKSCGEWKGGAVPMCKALVTNHVVLKIQASANEVEQYAQKVLNRLFSMNHFPDRRGVLSKGFYVCSALGFSDEVITGFMGHFFSCVKNSPW